MFTVEYKDSMKGIFSILFKYTISGFGKLYLIVLKTSEHTFFKVFSLSFDHDLMDSSIQMPSVTLII